MGLGLLISLRSDFRVDLVLVLFFIGIISSQLGTPMRNRWDRHPRIDELLDSSLKGLDKRFAIFHYSLGANHVLFTPSGVFAIVPRLEDGQIEYRDHQWTRTTTKGGFLRRAGTRPIKGVERQAAAEANRVRNRNDVAVTSLAIQPLVVFVNTAAEVKISDSPLLTVHYKKLKPTLRKLPKAETLTADQVNQLAAQRGLA